MNHINRIILICLCVMIYGCATPTDNTLATIPDNVYLDAHFKSIQPLETEQQIFHLSEEMRRYVQIRLRPKIEVEEKAHRMVSDFFDPEQLDIQYVHNANLTASDAFELRQANCLSLTILSYVLAQEARLNAEFRDVEVVENWTYNKGVKMLNGHVNLRIKAPADPTVILKYESSFVIDFLPMLNLKAKKSMPLSKTDIIALFYNNKGADALVHDNEDLAYQYFKQATQLAPHLSESWGNLASLYLRRGLIAKTEQILRYANTIDPDNLNIKESLAHIYQKTNRQAEAEQIFAEIIKIRSKNPYYYAMLGKVAYASGDYQSSIEHYKKAIKLNSREHNFLFGLAQNYLSLEHHKKANYYLQRARSLAKDHQDIKKYDNKIVALQSLTQR